MSYDERHIGNKIKSKKATCPNCGKHGIDKDGYCVYCGEYIGIHDDTKATIALVLGVVNLILSCVILFMFSKIERPVQNDEPQIVSEVEVSEVDDTNAETKDKEDNNESEPELVAEEGTVDEVLIELQNNIVSAKSKYIDKEIVIKGILVGFSSDGEYFYLGPYNNELDLSNYSHASPYVWCSADKEEIIEKISMHSIGDELTVYGTGKAISTGSLFLTTSKVE